MSLGEDQASFWTRLLRCPSPPSVEDELRVSAVPDALAESYRAAWRAHRAALARADARLDIRARDLDALQALGRTLAEARTLEDLFERVGHSLPAILDADALAIASSLSECEGVHVFVARPLSVGDIDRLREIVGLGFVPVRSDADSAIELAGFDRLQGPRAPLTETDASIVPVLRRGREILRLAAVPRLGPSERCLRILYGASNYLAIHVDRVLAVTHAEQGRFRAILDSLPHAVILVDASFRIAQSNASADALAPRLGVEAGEALRAIGDLDLAALSYDVLEGRRVESEGEARLPDGSTLKVTLAPWRGPDGRPDGLVIVMLDVTTARRLREQVTQSEKLSSLGRMIAGVAHELNNPLTAVIGYAQLLRAAPDAAKMPARVDTIRREAERCRRIVQNLLRFARPHAPERRPFSINETVDNVSLLLAYPVRSSGCRFELDLDRSLPSIVGDSHELEQVVVNLVTNSLQAMSSQGRSGAISLRTFAAEDGRVGLDVADEGPGIADDLRAQVFDPFFTTKPVGQGTGLGLWLVYNTVTAHGGTIDLAPASGAGATFRLRFPAGGAVTVEPESAPPIDDAPAVSARILVLDAEAALAALICDALSAEGHRPVAATGAEEALARLTAEPFDLLVSDAELPGLPGARLAAEVQRLRPDMRHRILLTTGDGDSRDPETVARQLGAGLLRKPFELDELRRVVHTRLRVDVER
jgi:two-component system NtrC family sensor kinase